MEGTVNKIRRQLFDLQGSLPPDERADVWVEGMTPEGYLQRFAWNEAKYPSRRPLKDTVAAITDTVQKLDDDLKVGGVGWCAVQELQCAVRVQCGVVGCGSCVRVLCLRVVWVLRPCGVCQGSPPTSSRCSVCPLRQGEESMYVLVWVPTL